MGVLLCLVSERFFLFSFYRLSKGVIAETPTSYMSHRVVQILITGLRLSSLQYDQNPNLTEGADSVYT